jgi:hypothetical protein
MYGLGMGISTVFEVFDHLLIKGDRTSLYGHVLHTIRCYLTREYTWFVGLDLNNLQDILALPVSRGTGPFRMVMAYTPSADNLN